MLDEENYAKTFYIKINDVEKYDKIYNLIKDAKWREIYPMVKVPNLLQWMVYKYIKFKMGELCNEV